jgi:hypothetical protein
MAPAEAPVKLEKPDPNVRVLKNGAHKWLVGIGVGLLVVWLIVLGVNRLVGNETKETTQPAAKATEATTKTTKTKELAPETLLAGLLGTGAALILVGFLYARISAIKLPGGVEILTEKDKETAAEGIKEGLKPDASKEQTVAATQAAESAVRRAKAAFSGDIQPHAIKAIAQQVASEVT